MKIDKHYRQLKKDEIILPLDEIQNDDGSWSNTTSAGDKAPDPQYTAHRQFRRRVVDQERWMEDLDELRKRKDQALIDWGNERNEFVKQIKKLELKIIDRDLRIQELLDTPIKNYINAVR